MRKNDSLLTLINSLGGIVIENDFVQLNENMPLEHQLTLLDEDMLMIEFNNNLILSVGWHGNSYKTSNYQQYKSSGNFIVCVVYDHDWENVLQKLSCNTIDELKFCMQKAFDFITSKDFTRAEQSALYAGPSYASKYRPDVDIRELEFHAWHNGKQVTNGQNWKVFKFDTFIGATSGQETQCVLIKCKNNTIHGHLILECEYSELTKITAKNETT